jgi:N-acetylglucosaminyldiphosphoundecaprenol N-acetyl-beta-D-mannosaminyltransferase
LICTSCCGRSVLSSSARARSDALRSEPLLIARAPRERILDHPVHPVTKAQAARAVVERALEGDPGAYVCLTNVHTTIESRRLPELRAAADSAFLSVPDGMPLVWILRRRGYAWTEKVTGIEYMPLVASVGRHAHLRHFIYGGAPGVAQRAARRLERLVPGADVVGATSPPYAPVTELADEDLREELEQTKPHILWVGLGAPKQELWMARVSKELGVPVMIGVGAGIDYLAETKPTAPTLLRHVGLEWAFRLAAEPRRLWRRYVFGNAAFLWLLARERFGTPSRPERSAGGRGMSR